MKQDRVITKFEIPPISIEASEEMRNRVTDALRTLADYLDIEHDYEDVQTAAIPYMQWNKQTLEGGLIVLEITAEVLISPKPQEVKGESHIAYLKRVE